MPYLLYDDASCNASLSNTWALFRCSNMSECCLWASSRSRWCSVRNCCNSSTCSFRCAANLNWCCSIREACSSCSIANIFTSNLDDNWQLWHFRFEVLVKINTKIMLFSNVTSCSWHIKTTLSMGSAASHFQGQTCSSLCISNPTVLRLLHIIDQGYKQFNTCILVHLVWKSLSKHSFSARSRCSCLLEELSRIASSRLQSKP